MLAMLKETTTNKEILSCGKLWFSSFIIQQFSSFLNSIELACFISVRFPPFICMLQLLLDFFYSMSLLFNIDFPLFFYSLKKLEFFLDLYVIVALLLLFSPFSTFQCRYAFHCTSLSFIMLLCYVFVTSFNNKCKSFI